MSKPDRWTLLACLAVLIGTGAAARAADAADLPPGVVLRPAETRVAPEQTARLAIHPPEALLTGPGARQRLLATAVLQDGVEVDVTGQVEWRSAAPAVARLDAPGLLAPAGDGTTRITARYGGHTAEATVTVEGAAEELALSFVNDVLPVLSRAGCNQSACHGSPAGQADFKLSLFGYEPELDYEALVRASGARRVNWQEPENSLLLAKPTGQLPHGGGVRFTPDSEEYRTLLAWLRVGGPGIGRLEARVRRLELLPAERWLHGPGAKQQLVVLAHMSDGAVEDVTGKALYSSNDDSILDVTQDGLAEALAPGETAVMVRHLGQVGVARLGVLPPWRIEGAPAAERRNVIDELVFGKLETMRVLPADLSADEEFLRRVYLDVCGIIPPVDVTRRFLNDPDPEKRRKLIDELLESGDFVDLWTLKWNDTLRNNPRFTRTGLLPFHNWIRGQLAANTPYDRFARELLTATGRNGPDPPDRPNQPAVPLQFDLPTNPAVNYYMVSREPLDMTATTSQVFMGVRLECARCHNHPFEQWTQTDYYALAQFFGGTRVLPANARRAGAVVPPQELPGGRRGLRGLRGFGARGQAALRHPRTNQPVEPRFLDGSTAPLPPGGDRRAALAEWLTAPENPYFAPAIVNRVWAHYFGRGIVDPVDDFRATNPPSNPELLEALAAALVEEQFDLKAVHRLILNSSVYQLSSRPNETNRGEFGNFSRAYPRRLMAEQLYDSIVRATSAPVPAAPAPAGGLRGAFGQRGARGQRGGPGGQRALGQLGLRGLGFGNPEQRTIQLPGLRGGGQAGAFLEAFDRSRREVLGDCDRSTDASLTQALVLMNSNEVSRRLTGPNSLPGRLARSGLSDPQAVEELFLAALTRLPAAEEREAAVTLIRASRNRQTGLEDVLWGLLNSREFLFNH